MTPKSIKKYIHFKKFKDKTFNKQKLKPNVAIMAMEYTIYVLIFTDFL